MTTPRDSDSPPDVLYHYCSAETLISILSNQTIRMGPVTSMNDFMEHSWLRKLAEDRVSTLQMAHIRSVLGPPDPFAEFLYEARMSLATLQAMIPYCACFSSDGDVLSQWRAYANDGKGFAVGFASTAISRFQHTELKQVIYDVERHSEIIETLLDESKSRLSEGMPQTAIQFEADGFFQQLLEPSTYCKNPAFKEEKEWRIVCEPIPVDDPHTGKTIEIGPADKSDFKVGSDGRLLHYWDVKFLKDFGTKTISEIVIGPKNPTKQDDYVLNLLLKEKEFSHVEIKESAATYR